MERKEILGKFAGILNENGLTKEGNYAIGNDEHGNQLFDQPITEQTHLITDVGMDSLDLVEVVMECETVFGITIPDQDAENMKKVGDVISYLDEKLNSKED